MYTRFSKVEKCNHIFFLIKEHTVLKITKNVHKRIMVNQFDRSILFVNKKVAVIITVEIQKNVLPIWRSLSKSFVFL